jgi:5-hydroxyisourate hydrolase
MPAISSTHVLDTAHGCPAHGMKIELWLLEGEERTLVTMAKTKADGRTEQPLLAADEMHAGLYEIIFFVGNYFAAKSAPPKIRFLGKVPVRFGIADAGASHHVPLLSSPLELFHGPRLLR